MSQPHLTFEQLSELAESRTPRADSREHLESCAQCRATLERVQHLIEAAHVLPREIAPPPEIWTQLRTRVGSAPRRRFVRRWHVGGWLAAAAAIVLIVGTALLLPPSMGKGKGKGAVIQRQTPDAGLRSPVVFAVEQNYQATLDELRRALDTQRSKLSPATTTVLERSLATIDSAIAEARAALASDPSNQALIQILSAQFEHKVELLQRAAELSSS